MTNKKKVRIFFVLLGVVCLSVIVNQVIVQINISSIDTELRPLLIMDTENARLVLHYFQKGKSEVMIPLPEGVEPWGDGQYDFDIENDEILMKQTGYGVIKYNFVAGNIQKICSYQEVEELLTNGYGMTNLQFVPNCNDISFMGNSKLYLWLVDKGKYEEIYDFSKEFTRLGFAYKWKNSTQLYMVINNNFVLYDTVTRKEKMIIENIGNIYFNMSSDQRFMVYQEQYGERRDIILFNFDSGEKKKIHVSKSSYKVDIFLEKDLGYIFLIDHHRDNHLGKHYWYLYDINSGKKIEVEKTSYSDYWNVVGW